MSRLQEFHEVRHLSEMLFPWFDDADRLEDGVLYICDGVELRDQVVMFNCPCGCGNVVMIPYYKVGQQKEELTSWGIREVDGRVTLAPSILSSGWPCRSHYFVRENKVVWC